MSSTITTYCTSPVNGALRMCVLPFTAVSPLWQPAWINDLGKDPCRSCMSQRLRCSIQLANYWRSMDLAMSKFRKRVMGMNERTVNNFRKQGELRLDERGAVRINPMPSYSTVNGPANAALLSTKFDQMTVSVRQLRHIWQCFHRVCIELKGRWTIFHTSTCCSLFAAAISFTPMVLPWSLASCHVLYNVPLFSCFACVTPTRCRVCFETKPCRRPLLQVLVQIQVLMITGSSFSDPSHTVITLLYLYCTHCTYYSANTWKIGVKNQVGWVEWVEWIETNASITFKIPSQ
jgi:hypothetical protein